jgi:hypothetical protein
MNITVRPEREQALRAGFAALAGRLPMDFEAFRAALASWDVKAFCDGERVVGMLMVQGPELHVAVLPEVRGRWLSRRLIREVFSPLLKSYGEAKTRVMHDNETGRDFVRRLGFLGEDVLTLREGFASGAFDPVTATVATVAGSLGGAYMQSEAAKDAAGIQADATNRGVGEQARQFNITRADQAPFREAGVGALEMLRSFVGLPGASTTTPGAGSLSQSFSIEDFWKDPVVQLGYQSGLEQGQRALKSMAPLTFGSDSGAAIKEATKFGQDYAGQRAAESQNRFEGNKSNVFNRLMAMVGGGQVANQVNAAAGANMANNTANLLAAQGNAGAASRIGQANAWSGALGNLSNWWQQKETLDRAFPRQPAPVDRGSPVGDYNYNTWSYA